jgi:hypothetical protein
VEQRGWSEKVWKGSGSGCSAYESKPTWQTDPSCAKRTDNDVAAVADPNTPVSLYDSYEASGWELVGGTSVATPIVAGMEAHASETVRKEGPEAFYRHELFDATSGPNGGCGSTYLCTGEEGYDGPTGWGTPDGPLELTVGYKAITQAAINTIPTGTTLTGYVNPEGLETTYYFEYGKTTSYGTTVPIPNGSAGSGVIWKGVEQSITGLEREMTYHYRLAAHNSLGTSFGKDHTVTTSFWSVEKTPSIGKGTLWGTSCVTTECIAVGEQEGKSLSERWNALEWKVKATPNPTGALQSSLEGVSCWAVNACTAVGVYENSSKVDVTLSERWNGTEWTIQSTPNPTGAKQSHLLGVSCVASTSCIAVGWYENSSGTHMALAEEWNGTAWTIQSTPRSTGTIESDQVSCALAAACMAVRSYVSSGDWVSLVESWNGSEWHTQEIPTPELEGHPAPEVHLRGISCVFASTTECEAAGAYGRPFDDYTLAERWNGKIWQIQSTPNLPEGGFNDLRAVSCVSPTACMASGQAGNETVFAERWSGAEWIIQGMAVPPVGGGISSVESISCVERLRATCTAVGLAGGAPLVESETIPQTATTEPATEVAETEATLDGTVNPVGQATKYYFEYGPTASYGSKTSEVSIGSGTSGVKVSHTLTGLTPGTYHFRVVGTSVAGSSYGADVTLKAAAPAWRITATPNPSGTLHSYLYGVSCKTNSECLAVGSYDTTSASEEKYVAEHWNGSSWSVLMPPEPSKTETAELYATSCGAVNYCLAVGTRRQAGVYFSSAEIWFNGFGWIESPPAEPAGSLNSLLTGTSCTAATTCMTVGWYEPGLGEEAAYSTQMSESKWTVKTTPEPSGAQWTHPGGVSCTLSTACTMVGVYRNSSGSKLPFAERWNGTEWTLQTVPVPSEAVGAEAEAVSCISASSCTAVGDYWLSKGGLKPLAEHWNGSGWTIQSVPQPGETESNILNGVSCTSTTVCMATGTSHYPGGLFSVPLAEQWNGSEWLAEKPPANEEGAGWLSGNVSCSEARWCAAVGNVGKTFAEIYG